ncbi:MAG: DNA polymerase III subunit gamma/tau [Halieaceae bacterium]|jgi:DNA polymerase-3 subunit gamma/tau|nr:DNA polymerase III subunit gamma/tau [Halieaceae bacterium]
MSHQVLARKWRPRVFREMVGQEHVLRALINALDHDRLHHAYLFTGTRGVGKTTVARILAKCLNCDSGVSSEPCGTCSSCLEIAEGRSVDLIEVDAASRTKVEDTRELLENVQYAPTHARYKVYLIDEVHMLSTSSFNALLKTLEEPPPHVVFLLATTDPQKLPATVLSRCLQFNLKNMSPELIVGHLKNVLDQEMISYEEPALWLLGRAAEGSMRDALSLTDQAVAFGSGKLTEADVRSMLGTVDLSFVYRLLESVSSGDTAAALSVVAEMSEHAPDYAGTLAELASLLHRVAITQAVPDAADDGWGDGERLRAFAAAMTAEDTQLFYQLAVTGKRDLGLAPDPRSGMEMTLLRMVAFRPVGAIDQAASLEDIGGGPEVAAPAKKPESASGLQSDLAHASPGLDGTPAAVTAAPVAVQGASDPGSQDPVGAPSRHVDAVEAPAAAEQSPAEVLYNPAEALHTPAEALHTSVEAADAPVEAPAVAAHAPAAPTGAPGTPVDPSEPVAGEASMPLQETASPPPLEPARWPDLLDRLELRGLVYNVASHCELRQVDGDQVWFVIDEANASLFNAGHTRQIEAALSGYLQRSLTVHIEPGSPRYETPAARAQRLLAERQAAALASIENDPRVQLLLDRFDGSIDRDSVTPIKH